MAVVAGCIPCTHEISEHGLAPRPQYDPQIDACITMKSCTPLCRSVFQLDGSVEVRSCKIELVDPANAHLVVRYDDDTSCASDDDGSYDDGGFYDDGGDDGQTDDGDTSDGGDDTGDDGGDSGGGDDGGGDSGGGDDGSRIAPHHRVLGPDAPATSQFLTKS